MADATSRVLEFGKPRCAVQLKLTDALLEALLEAQRTGATVQMNVGNHNDIVVGEERFPFKAHEASLQDIIRVPADARLACTEVAQVSQRLHVQRTVTQAERKRVRLRGLEAENQRRGRAAQVLDRAPKPGHGRKVVTNSAGQRPPSALLKPFQSKQATPRPSPPPLAREAGLSRPVAVAPPASRHPTPPPGRHLTPPPGMGMKGKNPHNLSKLGKAKRATPVPATGSVRAPALAVRAARRKLGLRKILMACIANERPKKPRLDQLLLAVAAKARGFRPSKEEVTRVLRDVADFKAPGVYVLTDYVQRRELPALQRELEPSQEPSRTPSSGTNTPAPAATAAPRPSPPGSPLPSPTGRDATPTMDWTGLEAPTATEKRTDEEQAAEKAPRGQLKRLWSGDDEQPSTTAAGKAKKLRKKRPREDQEGPAEPAAEQIGVATRQNGLLARPSDARPVVAGPDTSSSADAETSWFDEFVRPAGSNARVADTRAAFDALYDEHNRLYEIYTRLGRKINRFKREYQALVDSAKAGRDDAERARFEVEAEQYYTDGVLRVRRMDTAFRTIHAELVVIKAALTGFCEARARDPALAEPRRRSETVAAG